MDRVSDDEELKSEHEGEGEEKLMTGSPEQNSPAKETPISEQKENEQQKMEYAHYMTTKEYHFFNRANFSIQGREVVCTILMVNIEFFRSNLLDPDSGDELVDYPRSADNGKLELHVGTQARLNSEFTDFHGKKLVLFGFIPVQKQPSRCKAIVNVLETDSFHVALINDLKFGSSANNCGEYCTQKLPWLSVFLKNMFSTGSSNFLLKVTPVSKSPSRSALARKAKTEANPKISETFSPSSSSNKRKQSYCEDDFTIKTRGKGKQQDLGWKEFGALQKQVASMHHMVTAMMEDQLCTKKALEKAVRRLDVLEKLCKSNFNNSGNTKKLSATVKKETASEVVRVPVTAEHSSKTLSQEHTATMLSMEAMMSRAFEHALRNSGAGHAGAPPQQPAYAMPVQVQVPQAQFQNLPPTQFVPQSFQQFGQQFFQQPYVAQPQMMSNIVYKLP